MVLIAAAVLGGGRVLIASEQRDVQNENFAEKRDRFIGPFVRPPRADELPSLINLLEHDSSKVRCESAAALYAAGPQAAAALPALLKSVSDPDAQVRLWVASALASVAPRDRRIVPALIQLLRDESKRVQEAAVDALGCIGPAGKGAVPMLVGAVIEDYDRIDDYGTRASLAIETLGAIGPEAKEGVPLLLRVLDDKDREWVTRRNAADSLGKIGPAAKVGVPVLMRALLDKQVASDDSAVGTSLIINGRTVNDKSVDVRFSAARALGRIGPAAQRAVPSLIDALSDTASVPISEWIDVDVGSMSTTVVWTVRAAAAKTLGQIGPSAKPALPHLAKLLEGEDSKHRCAEGVEKLSVSGAIALLDPTARKARREVVAALKSNDAYVRREAATLLGQIGVREPLITSALQKATHDEYKHVRSRAREALQILEERQRCR